MTRILTVIRHEDTPITTRIFCRLLFYFFFYVNPSGCRMMDLEDLIADIKYTYTQSYCKSAIENLVPGTYIPIWIFRQKVSQNYSTNRQYNKANRKQQSIATKIR